MKENRNTLGGPRLWREDRVETDVGVARPDAQWTEMAESRKNNSQKEEL